MNSDLIHTASAVGSETEAVCELFAHGRNSEVFDYLVHYAESPLQVPFYYLKLVRIGKAGSGPATTVKPSAEQVELAYRAILQRPPEDSAVVLHQVDVCADSQQLISALLTSQEVIARMPALYARAFPLTRRLWHVHIPKTAGSSFYGAARDGRWGFVNTNVLSGAVGNLQQVAAAVRHAPGPQSRAIISGHWNLARYMDSIGPFDPVVVFVRDPLEMAISEFNYAVDVVNRSANVHGADPTPMLDRGLDPESFQRTYQRGFFVRNVQCAYLSPDATCTSALKNLTLLNADLLPTAAANPAITKYFAIVPQQRINVSRKHIKSADVSSSLREEILVESHHDVVLNGIAEMRYREFRGVLSDSEMAA